MKQTDRIEALQAILDTFLTKAKDRGYVVIDTAGDHDQYVQFQLRDGRVVGEVGSRQWREPERPLTASAVAGLGALGFTGGGPEKNYANGDLPATASRLAPLTDTLFRTAYELDDEYSFLVHDLVFNDVTLPRAQPFTREMIAHHLRSNGVTFLRDDDGDCRADFFADDMPGPVVVWLCAGGAGDGIYQIQSCAPQGPRPLTREEALERCNAWNQHHRWPKSYVADTDEGWRIGTGFDIDCTPGITQELLDTVTRDAVSASLDFWKWLGESHSSGATSADPGGNAGSGGTNEGGDR